MNKRLLEITVSLLLLLSAAGLLQSATIPLPNGSFESPAIVFVDLNIDSWQKTPKPDWYVESGGFLWSQLTGAFKNTAAGSFDHIDNCAGDQAVWMFAVPGAGLFQDYNSVDWNDPAPAHEFDARYEVGRAYALTAGVIGGGGGMSNGVTAEISFYYRDAASNQVKVAATSITNTPAIFSNKTHLIDFIVQVPTVKLGDAWADQHIGIQLLSTVSTGLQGGYWDFDNVRLTSSAEPTVRLLFAAEASGLRVSWLSETSRHYQVQASENLSSWSDFDSPLTGDGETLSKLVPAAAGSSTFVRVKASPSP